MRAPVSVVMAVRDAACILPLHFEALAEGLAEGLIRELIIVDRGSTDRTREMAEAAGAIVLSGTEDLTQSIQTGVAVAEGDWLLMSCGLTLLAEGWTQDLLRHMKRAPNKRGRLRAQRFAPRGLQRLLPPKPWCLAPRRQVIDAEKVRTLAIG